MSIIHFRYTPSRLRRLLRLAFAGLAAALIIIGAWGRPPTTAGDMVKVTIPEGSSLSQVSSILADAGIIRSSFLYKSLVTVMGGSRKVMAGEYLFERPQTVFTVAYRTVNGLQGLPQIKVTVPEGIAAHDIERLLVKDIPGFDGTAFLSLAKPDEGYLFPDTYDFDESVTPQQVISKMRDNFDQHFKALGIAVALSGRSADDVVKMASILEKEARTSSDRRVIAGILWKRIDNDMPLQVDAPFFYYLGKNSFDLTLSDLKDDSPYNLYVNKGLPPTPIGNPGLDSMLDAANPVKTDYWFYLSDKKSMMHYAVTHEDHLANKERYLQ